MQEEIMLCLYDSGVECEYIDLWHLIEMCNSDK